MHKICQKCFHHTLTVLSHYLRKVTLLLLVPFNSLFSRRAWVSQYQKDKTSLALNEVRDGGVLECSSISWTICKQSAPCSRQIFTPTPNHSIFTGRMLFLTPSQQYAVCTLLQTDIHTNTPSLNFYRPDALPDAQPTMSKH